MAAGLSLRTGISAGYTPMSPPAANTMTAGGVVGGPQSVSQMAYGISGTGATKTDPLPGFGAVGVGLAATAFLIFLWWSLPR